jgi:adenylyl- and sulfurtransferase ThiI
VALGAALAQPLASLAAARHLRRVFLLFSGEFDSWVVGGEWMVVERGARPDFYSCGVWAQKRRRSA